MSLEGNTSVNVNEIPQVMNLDQNLIGIEGIRDSPIQEYSVSTSLTASEGGGSLLSGGAIDKMCQPLDMKRESDRRKTYEGWTVPFMKVERLSAAGFFYMYHGGIENDVVRCAFCGVEVRRWEERDDPFRDHQRWSPTCGFVRGLPVGNVPVNQDDLSQTPAMRATQGYDVCGPYFEIDQNMVWI